MILIQNEQKKISKLKLTLGLKQSDLNIELGGVLIELKYNTKQKQNKKQKQNN